MYPGISRISYGNAKKMPWISSEHFLKKYDYSDYIMKGKYRNGLAQ